jgi:DNA polymerase-3 subunit alpha
VNASGVDFDVEGETIHYALGALKGVGRQAVEAIVAARAAGPFADLADFARRIDPRAVNKRVLESLAAAGAFDSLEPNRARVFAGADQMLAEAQRQYEARTSGALEFSFGAPGARTALRIPSAEPWLSAERLRREYDAIGFFLSGHPLDDYAHLLKRLRLQSWAEFSRAVKAGATAGRLAATVVSRTERRTKTGNKMGILGLSDPSGHYEAVIFAEGLQQYRDLLEPGAALILFLTAEAQGEEVRARIQTCEPLDEAAAKLQSGLRVVLSDEGPLPAIAQRLEPVRGLRGGGNGGRHAAVPERAGGANGGDKADRVDGEVTLVLLLPDNEVEVKLPGRYKISPQIAGAIKAVPGVVTVDAV